jgi:hypothetical protein
VLGVLSLRPWQGAPGNAVQPVQGGNPNASAGMAQMKPAATADLSQAASSVPAAQVDAWLAGAVGNNAALRLASIRALAAAPRERAVPVLMRIAKRGTDERERHAALDALEVQAAQQGDADDAIHTLLRSLVYDGSGDERLTERAQKLLATLDAGAAR